MKLRGFRRCRFPSEPRYVKIMAAIHEDEGLETSGPVSWKSLHLMALNRDSPEDKVGGVGVVEHPMSPLMADWTMRGGLGDRVTKAMRPK